MRNKDTGEFELVVGDKQLLSGFFIGVLLLAVVFAMGYVLGRGTPRSAAVAPEPAAVPANAAVERPQSPPSAGPVAASVPVMNPDVGPPQAAQAAEQPPQPTTVPAKDVSAPEPPPAKPAPPPPAEPATGTYWQVLAGSETSADALSHTLRDKGFPVVIRPGRDNLTLVWVGPYPDKDSLGKAKKKLEDAGLTPYKKP